MELIRLSGVSYTYGSDYALQEINMVAGAGELIGIIGPNGSGKTTLLKLIDGLLRPSRGDVFLAGRPLSLKSRKQIASLVAMVPQENYFLFPFSVKEVVLMGRFPHKRFFQFETTADLKIAHEAMKITKCDHLEDRSIQELSGGERQRVLIARALAQEPRILLMDEPTTFLDIKFRREFFQLIFNLCVERGLCSIVISHDIDLASMYCHKIIMLKQGRIYAEGAPADVVTSENIKEVFDCPVLVDKNPVTMTPRINIIDSSQISKSSKVDHVPGKFGQEED